MMVRDVPRDRISGMAPISQSGSETANLEKGVPARTSFDDLLAHRESVFRICLGFARDHAEAEDLAQDVYLRAYQNIAALKDPSVSKIWLLRIAKNACLDRNKKARVRAQLLRRWAEVASPGRDPEPPSLADDQRIRLKTAIRRLPKRLRSVLILRLYGQLSYDEIATALSLAMGTVMSRLNRARARISEMLEENHP
jgi:RNA polymerase sigma-70 factor (ECF subfamily)